MKPDILQIVPSISQESDGVANFATNLSKSLIECEKKINLELVTLDWAPIEYETNFVKYLLTDLIYGQDRKLDERLEQLSELSRIVAVVGD